LLRFERQLWDRGFVRLAGVDEAGRGPLAGPVVAAAVVFDRVFLEAEEHLQLREITDSKKIPPARRAELCALLRGLSGVEIGVGLADCAEIDRVNILRATHLAMVRAVSGLPRQPDHVLVDGLPVRGFSGPSTAVVHGDGLSLSIAAASIVAKVMRDGIMQDLDRVYPQYGFARHKGYGSSEHIQALFEHGPSPVHRITFRPVREAAAIWSRWRSLPQPAGQFQLTGE